MIPFEIGDLTITNGSFLVPTVKPFPRSANKGQDSMEPSNESGCNEDDRDRKSTAYESIRAPIWALLGRPEFSVGRGGRVEQDRLGAVGLEPRELWGLTVL